VWREADLDVMEARLKAVLSSLSVPGSNNDDVQQLSSPSFALLPNSVPSSSRGSREEVRGSLRLSPCSAEVPDASPERPMASGSGFGSATVSREGLEEEEEEGEEAVVCMGLPTRASDSCATENQLPDGWRLLPDKGVWRPWPMGVFIDSGE
jgi:hypothetical protein